MFTFKVVIIVIVVRHVHLSCSFQDVWVKYEQIIRDSMNTKYIQEKLCDVVTSFYDVIKMCGLYHLVPQKKMWKKSFLTAYLAGNVKLLLTFTLPFLRSSQGSKYVKITSPSSFFMKLLICSRESL